MSKILNEKELSVAIYNYLYELAQNWDAWRANQIKNPITYEDGENHIMSLIKANCRMKGEQESGITFSPKVLEVIHEAGFKPCKEWEND
jgi:hypothetical protein